MNENLKAACFWFCRPKIREEQEETFGHMRCGVRRPSHNATNPRELYWPSYRNIFRNTVTSGRVFTMYVAVFSVTFPSAISSLILT